MMIEEDRIARMFKNQTILITGGSGFIGKVLLEKLLRSTEASKIILLLRPKKDVEPKDRLQKLLNDEIFERIKRQMNTEEIQSRLETISGDIEKLNLGLSYDNCNRIKENVTIIYHLAATVRFDEEIKKAVEVNVRGTREMINLALECKNLKLFGYCSTAFCHLEKEILYEKSYDPPFNPHEMIEVTSKMNCNDLKIFSDKLLKHHKIPNSYLFTKSLAESLVVEAKVKKNLPTNIFRPSIVGSTWQDPIPGYMDTVNGIMSILLATATGILRVTHCDGNKYADIIPCDVVVNGIMLGTWNYLEHKNNEQFIVNLAFPQELRTTWREMYKIILDVVPKNPPRNMIWYPNITFTSFKWLFMVRFFLYQYIPAIVIDFFLSAFGYKKILQKMQLRIFKGNQLYGYFVTSAWNFDIRTYVTFRERLNKLERKIYETERENFSFEEYYNRAGIGARKFLSKSYDQQMKSAKRKMIILYAVDRIVKLVFYGSLLNWLFKLTILSSELISLGTVLKILICLVLIVL